MSNSPKFYAYAVKDRGDGKKGIWTKIGAAFAHEKHGGSPSSWMRYPFRGKIVLMPPKTDAATGETFESEVPNEHRALSQRPKLPREGEPRRPRIVTRADHDFYPTPPEAVRALSRSSSSTAQSGNRPAATAR